MTRGKEADPSDLRCHTDSAYGSLNGQARSTVEASPTLRFKILTGFWFATLPVGILVSIAGNVFESNIILFPGLISALFFMVTIPFWVLLAGERGWFLENRRKQE